MRTGRGEMGLDWEGKGRDGKGWERIGWVEVLSLSMADDKDGKCSEIYIYIPRCCSFLVNVLVARHQRQSIPNQKVLIQ